MVSLKETGCRKQGLSEKIASEADIEYSIPQMEKKMIKRFTKISEQSAGELNEPKILAEPIVIHSIFVGLVRQSGRRPTNLNEETLKTWIVDY